jgi:hypothetical protein
MPDEKMLDRIVNEVSKKHDVSSDLVRKMTALEQGKLHLERRRGITRDLRALLQEELDSKKAKAE